MKKYEKYRETEKARYALKHIKPEYYGDNDDESYVQAARYVLYMMYHSSAIVQHLIDNVP